MPQESGRHQPATVRALRTAGLLAGAAVIGLSISLIRHAPPLPIQESRFEDALFEDLAVAAPRQDGPATDPTLTPDSLVVPTNPEPLLAGILEAQPHSPAWLNGQIEIIATSGDDHLVQASDERAR